MLAYNGLALITEKLQNQRLEEPPPSSCCGKLPQVTQENTLKSDRPQQHKLSVKGKNVWALSVDPSDRGWRHDFIQPATRTPSSLRPPEKDPSSICRHKKLRYLCQICDTSPGTPSAPPKKKHCRSLSVPPDGPSTVLPSPRRDAGPKLLRPIAVLPLTNNNSSEKDRNMTMMTAAGASSGHGSMWLPRLSAGSVKLVPSPPSVDSGHFTTSDLQTPPGSPVPRPASAASDTSFSSLGSAWHDYTPMRTRARVLENRSLSLEDRISGASSTAMSMPCVHGGMDTLSRCRSSHGDEGSGCSSAIPRCHSQPCVLHHRRCGQKRRRDCDRPTLNFNKMTETAYVCQFRRSDPWNTPASDRQVRGSQGQFNFLDSASKNPFILNPIASSPLDSELPMMARQLTLQDKYEGELTQAANDVALPLTPPDFGNSPSLSQRLNNREERHDEEEEEDEDSEHRNCSCHDNRQDNSVDYFPMNDLDLEQIENC